MQTKTVKIGKRGNGRWFRIPAAIVKAYNLQPGEEVRFIQCGECEFKLRRVRGEPEVIERILTLKRVEPLDDERSYCPESEVCIRIALSS